VPILSPVFLLVSIPIGILNIATSVDIWWGPPASVIWWYGDWISGRAVPAYAPGLDLRMLVDLLHQSSSWHLGNDVCGKDGWTATLQLHAASNSLRNSARGRESKKWTGRSDVWLRPSVRAMTVMWWYYGSIGWWCWSGSSHQDAGMVSFAPVLVFAEWINYIELPSGFVST